MRERHGTDASCSVHHLRRNGRRGLRMGWPAERKRVRRALPGSYESLFHRIGMPRFELDLRSLEKRRAPCGSRGSSGPSACCTCRRPSAEPLLRRDPALAIRFRDPLDDTRAVEPLERMPLWEAGEPAETYPTGL